jgi:hypothetical protein
VAVDLDDGSLEAASSTFLGSGERAPAVSTCLPKEHLDNGAVKFRDNCTGEWRRRP